MLEQRWPEQGDRPGQADWLAAETARLLQFAEGSWHPLGGFGRQDDRGMVDPSESVELWITGRMTHCFALGELLGYPGSAGLVEHGLAALRGRLRDSEHGGWYPEVGSSGPVRTEKPFYQHCFVLLAAASALIAGHPGAGELVVDALAVIDERFWSEADGMVVETWDELFTEAEPYRGVNAAMHGVEAFLAAYDATGDTLWRDRAVRMITRVAREFAEPNAWRIAEHFDSAWNPLPDYNRDHPDDPFRPYGATVGHGLEWSRLCLHAHAALGGPAGDGPSWLVDDARRLFDAAVRDGWAADGADGFVYTVDWDGKPVVHQRMHWVLAEGVGAATTLATVTGDDSYRRWYPVWWDYAERYLIDRELGSWHHELDRHNRPSATVWVGKPDAYHAVQATLLPRIPVRASLARGVRDALTSGDLEPLDR
ncbi:AGE family epimerase/isomerase [Pseudonocardia sp. Cha107L01]|uniref:AGE family epimerase/isomerase n=1 Tax=Pseudonocardia sp. Cha107L01 TaxID=3457576 RepID=UPI00403E55EA